MIVVASAKTPVPWTFKKRAHFETKLKVVMNKCAYMKKQNVKSVQSFWSRLDQFEDFVDAIDQQLEFDENNAPDPFMLDFCNSMDDEIPLECKMYEI